MRLIKTLLLAATLLSAPSAHAAPVNGVDRILALVNDEIIMKSELESELSTIVQRLRAQQTQIPPLPTLGQQVLEKMISERLQLQAAEKAGIIIDEGTTDRAMQQIAKRNQLSLSDFRKALSSQGIDYLEFRDNLKKEIALEKLKVKQIENRINITDSEAKRLAEQLAADSADALRQYRIGHILVPLPDAASPEQIQQARQKAVEISNNLKGGADFRQTAIEQSSGANALEGGVLEWRTKAELPSLFARQLPQLQSDPFVGPIRSASGFHLLSIIDTREPDNSHIVTLSHARHILLKPTELKGDTEIRARLEIIRERVLGGESFAELARTNSEDGSAKDGGDLGWQNPENLVAEFVQEMDKLQPNEISPVFKSRFGWHIIQMVARKREDNTEAHLLSEARKMIRKRKVSEATESWLRRLRDEAYIEYRLEDI
jgi:peptidyl-prolyl cis-trans isomerase SurA